EGATGALIAPQSGKVAHESSRSVSHGASPSLLFFRFELSHQVLKVWPVSQRGEVLVVSQCLVILEAIPAGPSQGFQSSVRVELLTLHVLRSQYDTARQVRRRPVVGDDLGL